MSRDYRRPGNVANLVETHPEFSLVGREMIFRNCIDRTTITHFHLQNVSPHRVIEQLAFSAPLTQFMFLYVNNSQVYLLPQSPQHCIICSCVCNASAWWNGFWLLQSMTDSPQTFLAPNFLVFVGRRPLSYAYFVLRSILLHPFMCYLPTVTQSGDSLPWHFLKSLPTLSFYIRSISSIQQSKLTCFSTGLWPPHTLFFLPLWPFLPLISKKKKSCHKVVKWCSPFKGGCEAV